MQTYNKHNQRGESQANKTVKILTTHISQQRDDAQNNSPIHKFIEYIGN